MAPSKKKKANGFMVFTMEWRSRHAPQLSVGEATQRAGALWARMDADQRAPYLAKAKTEPVMARIQADNREKLTCTGTAITQVEKQKIELEQKERQKKRDVEDTVKTSRLNGELGSQAYYFIMANYFTKTIKGGLYVPAEISVCKFSLQEGVMHTYSSLINPGVDIYGHQYEAQHHSETTHNLPLPPNALGERDLAAIYNEILKFIKIGRDEYAPVYTHRDSVHIVESVLEFLKADIGSNNIEIRVFDIQYLFYILKEATCKEGQQEPPKNHFITDVVFERDYFEYQINIGCAQHESMDKSKYCTQSYVTRWGFVFADYMCQDIAITLKPGRHCPLDTNLRAIITPAPSSRCTDTESFVSLDTVSTISTKPPLSKKPDPYGDADEDTDDDRFTSVSAACRRNIDNTYTNDFPSLGASSGSRKKPTTTATSSHTIKTRRINSSVVDDDHIANLDEPYAHLNPWNHRSRNVPKEPNVSHFAMNLNRNDDDNSDNNSDYDDYNSVASAGRGRAIFNTSMSTTSSIMSRGRGRLFHS